MNLLAFESSAKAASVALMHDDALLGEYFKSDGQTHSRTLMNMARQLLNGCGLSFEDVDALAVSSGPGSFTGLRIGVAAAKGLAWGREIPCIGVSTLEAMAYGTSVTEGVIVCCMDARRNQVYNALFEAHGSNRVRLCEDRALSLEELAADLRKIECSKIVVGDGANLCYNTLGDSVSLFLPPSPQLYQHASGVATLARKVFLSGTYVSAAELIPNYIRPSQAERERAEKNRNEV